MQILKLILAVTIGLSVNAKAEGPTDPSIAGLYKTVLLHEGTKFYQNADVTLRTIATPTGGIKISANLKIYFGDRNSNEFLTYEFDDCPYIPLGAKLSIQDPKNNVSLVGKLKPGSLEGEWFSTVTGRVGKFTALKQTDPPTPADGLPIKTLSGNYKGEFVNSNPDVAARDLPDSTKITMRLVTMQDTSGPEAVIRMTGSLRMVVGGPDEWIQTKFEEVQFNFYNRYLMARTVDFGLTLKGTVAYDGVFKGTVTANGYNDVLNADLKQP